MRIKKRAQLELSRLDVFDAVSSIRQSGIYLGVGLFFVLLVAIGGARVAFGAGMSYGLPGPLLGFHRYPRSRARAQLVLAIDAPGRDDERSSRLKYWLLCEIDQMRVATDLGRISGIDDVIAGLRVSEADHQRTRGSFNVLHDVAKRCRNLDIGR